MEHSQGTKADWVRAALERYEKPLVRYAARFTGQTELARDVVQDTFLKLCAADRAKVEAHLAPWLYRVCRNRALDVMKKERRMQPLMTEEAESRPSPSSAPSEVAAGHETQAAVLEALEGLPEKQREAFRLKFQDQLSYKEISEVTGYPVNNVRYLIHTSLKAMREQLRGRLDLAPEA